MKGLRQALFKFEVTLLYNITHVVVYENDDTTLEYICCNTRGQPTNCSDTFGNTDLPFSTKSFKNVLKLIDTLVANIKKSNHRGCSWSDFEIVNDFRRLDKQQQTETIQNELLELKKEYAVLVIRMEKMEKERNAPVKRKPFYLMRFFEPPLKLNQRFSF